MTTEQWELLARAAKAKAEGREVYLTNKDGDRWPFIRVCGFGDRVVTIETGNPPPKLRPWKQDELPHNAMFRRKIQNHHYLRVTYSTPVYVNITGSSVAYDELLTQWEHNTGSGEWLPCGVEEGGTK